MTNGNESAMPLIESINHGAGIEIKTPETAEGLTKREYFSALAMQGICAGPQGASRRTFIFWERIRYLFTGNFCSKGTIADSKDVARNAIYMADALIARLNEKAI